MSFRSIRQLFLLSLGLRAPAMAVDYLWNVPSGNWSTAGNWTPAAGAGGPNTADAAIIRNGGTVTYDASANANVNRPLVGRDGTGTLTMNSGTHTANSYLFVGAAYNQNSSGTLNLTGGTLTVNGGYQHWGSASTYSGRSTGGQASVNGTAVINLSGTAALNLASGEVHLSGLDGRRCQRGIRFRHFEPVGWYRNLRRPRLVRHRQQRHGQWHRARNHQPNRREPEHRQLAGARARIPPMAPEPTISPEAT